MTSGLRTINRLLLQGARHHERDAVFSAATDVPDWRADRHALRVALALGEGLDVRSGDVVALWTPLGVEWPIVERGIWALGAVSLPLPADWSAASVRTVLERARPAVVFCSSSTSAAELGFPDSARALVAMEGEGEGALLGFGELMEQGGVLDTPERATRARGIARDVVPEAPASLEPNGVEIETRTQSDWARAVERFLSRYPSGGARSLLSDVPDEASRVVLYGGWADGLTRTVLGRAEGLVFGREVSGMPAGSFVNLSELSS